ncbi:MAG: LON peptidase substrate-binding domain-containing protein [Planctomycetes bacterium]|nr:LON peptidase substrate-binding domain-containing protein [Planctomycetota bacterium]
MASNDVSALTDFHGPMRLFPLPNVVLYPFVTQALHVFEPRYRQLTADALAGDRLLGLGLLRPGWEEDYEGRPALYPMACLGKIISEEQLEDGRYNIQLRGLSRARILQEVDSGKLYRCARVELLPDSGLPGPQTNQSLRRQLLEALPLWCRGHQDVLNLLRQVLKSNMPLGVVSDIISFALPLAIEFKQELLAESEVESRARALAHFLAENQPPGPAGLSQKFPPDFSSN